MATQLFFRDESADVHLGTDNLNLLSSAVGWLPKALATTRGSAGVTASDNVATVTGPTAGITVLKSTFATEWISPPVSADVTISGTITGNVWAAESNMSANVSICILVQVIRANATATRNSNTLVEIARRAPGTEIAVTTRAVNNFTVTPTSTVVNRGDRLRVVLFGDDVTGGVNMATGFTFNASWGGGTGAADGDTYVTFTETFSFESAPGIAEQTQQNADWDFGVNSTVQQEAQSFTALSPTLTEVKAWLKKTGAPADNLVLEIQTDSPGDPSGSVVGTVATVVGTTLTTTSTQYTYSTSIALTVGVKYWLVFRRSGSMDAANYYSTRYFGSAVVGWTPFENYTGSWAVALGSSTLTVKLTMPIDPLYLTNTQSGLTAAPALISDFTGADENPLSESGNWANLNSSSNPLKRLSNAAAATVNAAQNASYWTPANFGPDLDAYVTVSTVSGTVAGILARVQGEGGAATWDGYGVLGSTASFGIFRFTNAAQTTLLASSAVGTIASGDKIGIRCEGSTIQAWKQASGSSDWNLAATVVDTTYASAGKIALLIQNTTNALDDFYAATDSSLFTQKAWTSRGAGVVSYLSDTDAGWTAPLYTNEWFTPGLTAFTLTGMAQANIRALESNASANASLRCQVARVDNDGTNATVWADWCMSPLASLDSGARLPLTEVAQTVNVSGDDLAISDGQRLRIRIYSDDSSFSAMANAFNVQLFYNGTSAAASGDSYVTLAQSVTEFTPSSGAVDDVLLKVMQAVNRSTVY